MNAGFERMSSLKWYIERFQFGGKTNICFYKKDTNNLQVTPIFYLLLGFRTVQELFKYGGKMDQGKNVFALVLFQT